MSPRKVVRMTTGPHKTTPTKSTPSGSKRRRDPTPESSHVETSSKSDVPKKKYTKPRTIEETNDGKIIISFGIHEINIKAPRRPLSDFLGMDGGKGRLIARDSPAETTFVVLPWLLQNNFITKGAVEAAERFLEERFVDMTTFINTEF